MSCMNMRRPPSDGISAIVANPSPGGTRPVVQRARRSAFSARDAASVEAAAPGDGARSSTQAPQPSEVATRAKERAAGPAWPARPDIGPCEKVRITCTVFVCDHPTPALPFSMSGCMRAPTFCSAPRRHPFAKSLTRNRCRRRDGCGLPPAEAAPTARADAALLLDRVARKLRMPGVGYRLRLRGLSNQGRPRPLEDHDRLEGLHLVRLARKHLHQVTAGAHRNVGLEVHLGAIPDQTVRLVKGLLHRNLGVAVPDPHEIGR